MQFSKIILLSFILLTTSFAESQYAVKQKLLKYTNSIRAQGASCAPPAKPLRWNVKLERAANAQVADMAVNRYLSHKGSNTSYDIAGNALNKQSSFIDRIKYFGFPFTAGNLVGENIAKISTKYTRSDDVLENYKRAVQNWLKDPPHCKILMDNRFSDVGISYYKKGGIYYFVMDLGEIK